LGQVVASLIPENEAVGYVEGVLWAFEKLGLQGERIADTLARTGIDAFRKEMDRLRTEVSETKEERKGGGCCG